jgi:hypothetical protein
MTDFSMVQALTFDLFGTILDLGGSVTAPTAKAGGLLQLLVLPQAETQG